MLCPIVTLVAAWLAGAPAALAFGLAVLYFQQDRVIFVFCRYGMFHFLLASSLAVFATVHGEIQTADQLIADFRDNGVVSSARFALSVHNSPSGVYSVATANTAPTTTVTGDNAIAAGWLEAALTVGEVGKPVVLSIADEPVPEVFHGPGETVGFAAGFVLAPATSTDGRAAELVVVPGPDDIAIDVRHLLATLADPSSAPTTLVLGHIGPGAVLQLRLLP